MKRHHDESGQAMVEFTLIATVLATLLFAVFQFGVAFSDYISVADASRAAARKAATYGANSSYDPVNVKDSRDLAMSSSDGSSGHTCATDNWCTDIQAKNNKDTNWVAGGSVTATVTAPYSIDIFGLSVFGGTLKHSVTMRIENRVVS
jgi:Flp pilus assembly protein TadG